MALRPNLRPEEFLLEIPDEAGKVRWGEIFGNEMPVELEIGSGKGTFLLAAAQANRGRNFVGIEYANAYANFAADRLRRHEMSNARMVHAEASWWIRCHVPDGSLAAVHVYFPDPWPKTKQQKRRLVQVGFLKEVHRMLVPGGMLRLVTDHADYFAHMQRVLGEQTELKVVPFTAPVPAGSGGVEEGGTGMLVGTNFEKKYIAEGRTFHATAAVKE